MLTSTTAGATGTGIPRAIATSSACPSRRSPQRLRSSASGREELRYAGTLSPRVNFVAGGFVFHQTIDSDPSFKQEQGSAAARFLLAPTAAAATPGLLDGYGFNQFVTTATPAPRLFGQVDIVDHRSPAAAARPALQLRPEGRRLRSAGLRRPADDRPGVDRAAAVGAGAAGLPADVDDTNLSGQFTRGLPLTQAVNAYATYATGFKSVGLNLNGLPTDAAEPARALRGDGQA